VARHAEQGLRMSGIVGVINLYRFSMASVVALAAQTLSHFDFKSVSSILGTVAVTGMPTSFNFTSTQSSYSSDYVYKIDNVGQITFTDTGVLGGIDPYWENVPLLLHGTGANGSTTILNSAPPHFQPTSVTGCSITNAQAKWGTTSILVGGNVSNSIVFSNQSGLLLTGEFTVEGWYRYDGSDINLFICRQGADATGRTSLSIASGQLGFNRFGNATVNIGSVNAIPTNTWFHLAVTRSGSSCSVWLNGSLLGTFTDGATWGNGVGGIILGECAAQFYLSDFRVTNGTARYTGSFTPSVTPFSHTGDLYWIKNVLILSAMNNTRPVDYSQLLNAITHTAVTTSSAQAKFGSLSFSFNGTTSYLSVPNGAINLSSSDFTIEMWVYSTNNTGSHVLFDGRATAGSSIGFMLYASNGILQIFSNNADQISGQSTLGPALNGWTHIALCRSGTSIRAFVDGVITGTWVTSATFADARCVIGRDNSGSNQYWSGYMDQVRISKGIARYIDKFPIPTTPLPLMVDPYFNQVALLLNFNGSNGSTTFTDASINVNTVGMGTGSSGAPFISSFGKFGSALFLDGVDDSIAVQNSSSLNLAVVDFTIEAWIYLNSLGTASTGCCILEKGEISGSTKEAYGLRVYNNGSISGTIGTSSGTVVTAATSPAGIITTNTWYHVAFTFTVANNAMRVFVNGAVVAIATAPGAMYDPGTAIRIGQYPNGGGNNDWWFSGYIDDIRITRGVARYTAPFVPPVSPFVPKLGMNDVSAEPNAFTYDVQAIASNTVSAPITLKENNDKNLQQVKLILNDGSFTDKSPANITLSNNNGLSSSSSTVKFAGFSTMSFPGPSGGTPRLELPAGAHIAGEDATVEAWIYPTTSGYIWSQYTNGTGDFANRTSFGINASGNIYFQKGGSAVTGTTALAFSTWHFVEMSRVGSIVYIFANGNLEGTLSISGNFSSDAGCLGAAQAARIPDSTAVFTGNMGPVRITIGSGRHTSNYSIPGDVFPVAARYHQQILADSPVMYYRLNEVIGTTAFNSGSTGIAGGATGIAGTYNGTYTLNQAGFTSGGGSVLFSGTSASCVNTSITTGYTTLSIEFFFNADGSNTQPMQFIVGKTIYDPQTASDFPVAVVWDGSINKLRFRLSTGNDLTVDAEVLSNVLTPGQDYHVVATYSAGGTAALWVNGVSQGSVSTATITINSNTVPWRIGAAQEAGVGVGVSAFKGRIGEVAIYNTVLSSTRIAAHYAAR
jgi:hypothetical protein